MTRREKVKKKKREDRQKSCVCAFDVFHLFVSVFSVWCVILSFVNVVRYIEFYCITCVRGFLSSSPDRHRTSSTSLKTAVFLPRSIHQGVSSMSTELTFCDSLRTLEQSVSVSCLYHFVIVCSVFCLLAYDYPCNR